MERLPKATSTKHGKTRRNFYLPDTLMAQVESYADRKGVSMTAILTTALSKYLDAVRRAEEQASHGG